MLILITTEENHPAEKEQLIHFFENGLRLLHVRKPKIKPDQMRGWLEQFEEKQLQKMILHNHHHLAAQVPVKGIHLRETDRRNEGQLQNYLENFRSRGLSISSSFHDLEELEKEAQLFDYVFLSPVFSSLSKSGYCGRGFEVGTFQQKIIALGGITAGNIEKTKALGYSGVAVLGAVWLAKNIKKEFKNLQDVYSKIYRE